MKKIYSIAFSLATLLFAVGCTQEPLVEDGGDIVIRLGVDGMDTKAPATGGERTVNSLDVYVFKADEITILYYEHVSSPTLTDGKYVQSTNFAGMSNLSGTDPEKEAIVKAGKVYAIANYPGTLTGNETLAELKAQAINDALYREGGKVKADPVFVMTGESADGNAFASGGTDITVADITLKRVTTKMTVKVNFAASPITTSGSDAVFGETTTTWEPMTDGSNFRVMLQNAVSGATLGGVATTPSAAQTAGQVFSYEQQNMVSDGGSGFVSPAFYTYPVQWTDAGDENAPFIKLVLPWKYTTKTNEAKGGTPAGTVIDQNVVERYYKVILPDLKELVANTWYQPTVTLTIKPGEGNVPVVVMPDGISIRGWNNDEPDEVDITTPKYLLPEKSEITVNNGNSLEVMFYASGRPTLTVDKVYYYKYNAADSSAVYYKGGTPVATDETYDASWVKYDQDTDYNAETGTGKFTIAHTLSSNSLDGNYSVRPYIYEITLSLAGVDPQKITVIQNPPQVVRGFLSTGYVNVNTSTSGFGTIFRKRLSSETKPSQGTGYTDHTTSSGSSKYRLNVSFGSSTRQRSLGGVETYRYLGTDNNCEFLLKVQVGTEDGYTIGDPRIDISTNQTNDNKLYEYLNMHYNLTAYNQEGSPLTRVEAERNSIKAYKPTAFSGVDKYVAPEFIVSSSFGRTTDINYVQALNRCASYQEDGYPAGRWRIPTDAEIKYMLFLQKEEVIPELFGDSAAYFSSSGNVYTKTTNTLVSNIESEDERYYVRCVYDSWYWGDKMDTALEDGIYPEGGKNYQKYKWGGYKTTK